VTRADSSGRSKGMRPAERLISSTLARRADEAKPTALRLTGRARGLVCRSAAEMPRLARRLRRRARGRHAGQDQAGRAQPRPRSAPAAAAHARRATRWHLRVDEATPHGTTPHDLDLTVLKHWREIPEFALASATGTYTTTLKLPNGRTAGDRGSYLDLGSVGGAMQAYVNGRPRGRRRDAATTLLPTAGDFIGQR
jgi:hypothetical protein